MFRSTPALSNIQLISVHLPIVIHPWRFLIFLYNSALSADNQLFNCLVQAAQASHCNSVLILTTQTLTSRKTIPINKLNMAEVDYFCHYSTLYLLSIKRLCVAIIIHICSTHIHTQITVHSSNKNRQEWEVWEGIILLHLSKLVYLQQHSSFCPRTAGYINGFNAPAHSVF